MTEQTPNRRGPDSRLDKIEAVVNGMDKRLALVERELQVLDRLETKLDSALTALAEPQGSASGRALLDRSVTNAERITRMEARREADLTRMDRLEGWVGIEDPPVPGRLPLISRQERSEGMVAAFRVQMALVTTFAALVGAWIAIGRPVP